MVSPGIILVATVNSIGATFQFIYIIIFIVYAENAKKVDFVLLIFLAILVWPFGHLICYVLLCSVTHFLLIILAGEDGWIIGSSFWCIYSHSMS